MRTMRRLVFSSVGAAALASYLSVMAAQTLIVGVYCDGWEYYLNVLCWMSDDWF